MTLSDLTTLHAYSSWATLRLFETLAPLPPALLTENMKVSHGSIHGTMVHMIGAEKIWLERWKGAARQPFLTAADAPDLEALKRLWTATGREMAAWLGTLNDRSVNGTFTLTTKEGKTLTYVTAQAFQHLVNHSTYHRGQIVALLRQIGFTPPATDFIVFLRETSR